MLEELSRQARLEPVRARDIHVPFEAANRKTLERALLASGAVLPAIEHSGEQAVREKIVNAAARFRQADDSYRLENRFRYLISDVPALDTTA